MHSDKDLKVEIHDGFKIAQILRNQVSVSRDATSGDVSRDATRDVSRDVTTTSISRDTTSDATAAFSTATFQGKESESHGNQTCFEGFGRHTLDRCFYLRKDLRPNGWAMKTGAVKLMLEGLNKQPDLQERHQEAIKEMEDFLDESKKGSRSIIGSA